MKKIKLLIMLLVLTLAFVNLAKVSASEESAYTISGTVIDEETNELAYQKVTYSTNTYKTMNVEDTDAIGQGVEVSRDAQYVFLPARYNICTDSTNVSIKFKNNGVERIYLHAEYAAGISDGGVDYEAGYTFVCVNALPDKAWNAKGSKSVDGYDVVSVEFGSYAAKIHDFQLVGFRLYFDYGLEVNSTREFEIFGVDVHEGGTTPSFASDPKPTRVTALTSEDTEIVKNAFNVDIYATVTGKIKDYKTDYYKLAIDFTLDNTAKITFKLDGNVALAQTEYKKGNHKVELNLTEEDYELLEMVFFAIEAKVKVNSIDFYTKPYLGSLSGSSAFMVTEEDGVRTVKYSYKNGYSYLDAPVRNYNTDYDYLKLNFTLSQPVVLGIQVVKGSSEEYLRSHWDHKEPMAVGSHELLFNITEFDMDNAAIRFYFDPPVESTTGTDGETVVTFTNLEFVNSDEFPKATIVVNPIFEFNYDGNEHAASGATTNSGAELTYEYKLEGTSDEFYSDALPIDGGRYDVRITSPLIGTYGLTYAYAKLIINKIDSSTPSKSVVTVNYENNTISYDESLYLVALDENFKEVVLSGSYVLPNTKLYYKQIETTNYKESAAGSFDLASKANKFDVTLDSTNKQTVEIIPETVEYSTDGLTWFNGSGEKLTLEAGYIYLFRTKATSSTFASDLTYLNLDETVEVELDKEEVEEEVLNMDITYTNASSEEYQREYVVTNYDELYRALNNTSNNYRTNIIIKGSIYLDYNITVKGKVTFTGMEGSELVFEKDGKERQLVNSKNSEIKFVNITLSRTVKPRSEYYMLYFKEDGVAWFTDVTFNVAADESLGTSNRVTYVPGGKNVTLYFVSCTFNTPAYFYRGTMVFIDNELVPANSGSPTIYNFNEFKVDYETKTVKIGEGITVSKNSELTELVKSGSTFENLTTFYLSKNNKVFKFTTKNMKLVTPTLDSIHIDYYNETVNFNESFLVSKNANFTELLASGDAVSPGMKLYIKQLGTGIYEDSDVCEVTLPERSDALELTSAYTTTFGFVMELYPNAEYMIDGEYQLSPVFVNLESNTKYTVTVRVGATDSSFASETYQVEVTTK